MMNLDESFKTTLMLAEWDRFEPPQCEAIAQELDRILPEPFRFHKIETCSFLDQRHHIAIFEWNGPPEGHSQGFFALIPGGEAELGYDREHPFVPDKEQQESWIQQTERTGMFSGTLDEFLDLALTPLRQVMIEPFLLETVATPLEAPPTYNETLGEKGGWYHYPQAVSYEQTLKRILRDGFRFPTSDEWEYACAAGSRTLFRWGDRTPPFDMPILGNEKATTWDLHLRQNAFGLLIARQPYHWEFCAEPGLFRGGDGGTALHAGVGTFAEWLTLASAFHSQYDEEDHFGVCLRRAFSLF